MKGGKKPHNIFTRSSSYNSILNNHKLIHHWKHTLLTLLHIFLVTWWLIYLWRMCSGGKNLGTYSLIAPIHFQRYCLNLCPQLFHSKASFKTSSATRCILSHRNVWALCRVSVKIQFYPVWTRWLLIARVSRNFLPEPALLSNPCYVRIKMQTVTGPFSV